MTTKISIANLEDLEPLDYKVGEYVDVKLFVKDVFLLKPGIKSIHLEITDIDGPY